MALTLRGAAILTTDGTAQYVNDGGTLIVAVAELDTSSLAAGDELVVRWRVQLFSNTRTIWQDTITADGTQEGYVTPPMPMPDTTGFLELEQTTGPTGKDVPWLVLNL